MSANSNLTAVLWMTHLWIEGVDCVYKLQTRRSTAVVAFQLGNGRGTKKDMISIKHIYCCPKSPATTRQNIERLISIEEVHKQAVVRIFVCGSFLFVFDGALNKLCAMPSVCAKECVNRSGEASASPIFLHVHFLGVENKFSVGIYFCQSLTSRK